MGNVPRRPGKYFWHGLVMTGGHSLAWFLDNFGETEKAKASSQKGNAYDLLLDEAAKVSAGSGGLIFLPFLDGAATPYYSSAAKASFIGATSHTTKATFTRAVWRELPTTSVTLLSFWLNWATPWIKLPPVKEVVVILYGPRSSPMS